MSSVTEIQRLTAENAYLRGRISALIERVDEVRAEAFIEARDAALGLVLVRARIRHAVAAQLREMGRVELATNAAQEAEGLQRLVDGIRALRPPKRKADS